MNNKIIQELSQWVMTQITQNPYSDIGFTLTIHEGKITRFEKQINVKILNNGYNDNLVDTIGDKYDKHN